MHSRESGVFDQRTRPGAEEILARLVQEIVTGQIRASDRLPPEDQLAAQFNVAPMTLRQALARLRELGLTETRRGRHGGTYIRVDVAERLEEAASTQIVTQHDLRELSDWRRAVSGESAYFAAIRASQGQLGQLKDLAYEYNLVYARVAERRFADSRFHIFIAEISQSVRLLEAERDIQEQVSRMLRILPSVEGDSFSDHASLVDAIANRRPEEARNEMIKHIESTYSWGSQHPLTVKD